MNEKVNDAKKGGILRDLLLPVFIIIWIFKFLFKSPRKQSVFEVFIVRLILATILVTATYNTTEYSIFSWASNTGWNDSATILVLLCTAAIWLLFFIATKNLMGYFGLAIMVGLFAAFTWFFYDKHNLDLQNVQLMTWYCIGLMSLLFAVGSAGGIAWRRFTGQMPVVGGDEDDE